MFYSKIFSSFVLISLFCGTVLHAMPLKIVATSTDLADLVRQVGGEHVQVYCLTQGNQDLHFIDPRPSMVVRVKEADILVRIGMGLDQWVESLILTARNPNVFIDGPGYLDGSRHIEKGEVPLGRIDGRMGDIHPYGNPHYWLDPMNVVILIQDIQQKLSERVPSKKEFFQKNAQNYVNKLNASFQIWEKKCESISNKKVVIYHNSWPYFMKRFGFEIGGTIEPKPGIPPGPLHLAELKKNITDLHVKMIVLEPHHPIEIVQKIVSNPKETKVAVLPTSVNMVPRAASYLDLMDILVETVCSN